MATPNSLSTTGRRVPQEDLEKMSTSDLLAYFCEVRYSKEIYESEAELIKEIALARKDLPRKFIHPTNPVYGGCSQKGTSGKWIISALGVLKTIGQDLAFKCFTVSKTELEKVSTNEQWEAMVKAGTIQGGDKGTTLQYDKA